MSAVDCHALVYAADRARYPFAGDAPPLQPGELEACAEAGDLAAAIASRALSRAVLVQRNRFYGFDNALICDLAASDARFRALVSVDSRAPAGPDQARRLLALPGIAGVRLMEPEKGAALDWLDGEHARAVWSLAADAGALVDVHLFPWNRAEGLARLAGLLGDFTGTAVLLDNLGNGPIESGAPDWGLDAALDGVADSPRLTFKFSEMTLGRLDRAGLDPAGALAAIVGRLGADRVVWGSDVLPPGRSLADAAGRAAAATALLSATDRHAVLAGNAARLFFA